MDERASRQVILALATSLALGANAAPRAEPAAPQYPDVAALENLPDPPIANGAVLGPLLKDGPAGPGEVTLMYSGGAVSGPRQLPLSLGGGSFSKSNPTAAPSLYSNLVFTAVTPCRILDSRPAYGGAGRWSAASTNTVKVGPYAGGYAFQGGSATDCGLPAVLGSGKIAAVMASVTTVTPSANGFLTFFSYGGPNPFPYGVSQFYAAGGIGTAFVVMPTDLSPPVWVSAYTTQQVDVVIDIVGYFAKPSGQPTLIMGRAGSAGAGACVIGPGSGVTVTSPACSGAGLASVATGVTAGYAVRNLQVTTAAAMGSGGTFFLMSSTPGGSGFSTLLTCTIVAGGSTCSDSSTSAAISAGQALSVELDGGLVSVSYSYELVGP